MSNTMNAVIYARYSPGSRQTDRSIEGQLQDCYEYATRCGYTIVGTYEDKHLTGTNDLRPGFQKMLDDAKKKQFQYILVYKLDRFARNRYDSAIYKRQLKRYDVRVISAMEQISNTPEGIMLESLLEGMAEYYSANLSQHVKRGRRVAIQNKGFVGGTVPYGYRVENKVVEINEKEAHIVKWVFEQYADGVALKDIIHELKVKGYRNRQGNEFTSSSFSHMLSNKKYIGIYMYDGEEHEGIFSAIIDKELFERVQKRVEQNRRAPATAKAQVRYLLQSKLFCGYCGSTMVGDMAYNRAKNKYYYYSCRGRKDKLNDCKKKREKKDFLEWYVVEQTLQYVLAPERLDYIAERIVKAYNDEFDNSSLRAVENRIKEIDVEIDKNIDLALNTRSDVVRKRVDDTVEKISAEKEELMAELSKLKIANKVQLTEKDVVKWLKSFCDGDITNEEFRQSIIDTFINAIYLFDDKVVLYYNIKDSKQVSYIDMLEDVEESEKTKTEEQSSDCSSVRISNEMVHHHGLEPWTP